MTADKWDHPYTREQAAYPGALDARAQILARGRLAIDNVYGDRNLFCTCPPMEGFAEDR